MIRTPICDVVGIEKPVFQGGMAWIADASLASAVSNAGGLGVISAMNADAEWLRGQIRACRELTERFELDPSKKVRTYSKGNRQKVALVAALAAPTRLLILDEPTSGLDPLMERVFTEEVAAAAAAGRTVLLSSHILAEVQRLCGAVTIIKDGRVVEDGGLEHLQSLAATRIELRAAPERLAALEAALAPLGADPERDGDRLVLQVGSQRVPEVLGAVAEQRIVDVRCEPASLEDLFLRHYEDAR